MPRSLKTINVEIGARIKKMRKALKLTQEQLANRVGYSTNFVQEVEQGRSGLSSESMKAFSDALHVSADEILFGAETDQGGFIVRKLSEVPEDKRRHILRILDEAIECSK